MIKPGIYKHYKGKLYMVQGIAKNSETLEDMVIYRALYNDEKFGLNALWARPLSMFQETVEINGETQQRFSKLDINEASHILKCSTYDFIHLYNF